MTIDELKIASRRHETVVFEGAEYTCIGVQVLYRMRERIVSACLEDKQKRLLWARIEKIQKNKN